MVDLGELIGGIMSGLSRARRDADLTSALIAEEYKLHSLLSGVSAPRVRLSGIEIDLPVILNSANSSDMKQKSGVAMTSENVLQALAIRLQTEGMTEQRIKIFVDNARADLDTLFGGEVRGISGESISRIAQRSVTRAYQNTPTGDTDKEVHVKPKSREKTSQNVVEKEVSLTRVRSAIDLEARRIGRELTKEWPTIDAIAETEKIKEFGSDAAITRIKIKLVEEGLEWTTSQDEQGNKISRLISE
jgi:hypothetical protein